MSSLILGFIGIVLFTGMVLYGATYIGSGIENGQDNATAVYTLTQMAALGNAVIKFEVTNNVSSGATVGNAANYTDTPVVNPISAAKGVELADASGNTYSAAVAGGTQASFTPAFVVMDLGSSNSLCTAMAAQSNSIARGASVSTTAVSFAAGATKEDGCFKANYLSGTIASGDYVAYTKLS